MSDFSLSKSLRILALKSVLNPDIEYFYRRVFRWYSKEFHTPLHLVEKLPLEDVLQAYYESRYEDIIIDDDNGKLIEELQELTETERERLNREMKQDFEKIADDDYLAKVIKEEQSRKKPALSDLKTEDKSLLNKVSEMPDIKLNFNDVDEPDSNSSWGLLENPNKKQ